MPRSPSGGSNVPSGSPDDELRHLRALVGDLDAIVWEADASGRFTFVSEGSTELLGYPPSAFVSEPSYWADHIHPDDRDRAVKEFTAGIEHGRAHDIEYRFLHRNGTVIWLREIGHAVGGTGSHPRVARGLMVDVTEQKVAEDRRAEVEQRYRRLVEQLPGMVYLESVEPHDHVPGRLLYVSPQVERVLGFTVEEWMSDPSGWVGRVHPDDVDGLRAAYWSALPAGDSYRTDYRMTAKGGGTVWIHDEATLVRDDDGTPLFWQGVMFDVTERMRVEIQLREAEQRYRALVEQTPVVTYIDALDGSRTLYISPQVEALLGFPPGEFTGGDPLWPWIVHPDDRERLRSRTGQMQRTRRTFNAEYRLVGKDGRTVWVHDQAVVIDDEEGEPAYWQGVWVDITERKRAQQLERALEAEREEAAELRALDEMKNTFLAAVSHDLRTPLAAILGLAVTLEKQTLGEADTKKLASRVAANARRLDRMVTDLLDLDRLSRGIVEPNLETIDVGALVAAAARDPEIAGDREISIDTEPVEAEVDASKIERIIENLLGNAVRHTPPAARIWVSVRAEARGVLIVVEDDGPGVAPEHREEIFQPFRQVGAPEHAPGVGIGLALVASFAELHGGRAWVQERDGGGSSFRVWLPAAPP